MKHLLLLGALLLSFVGSTQVQLEIEFPERVTDCYVNSIVGDSSIALDDFKVKGTRIIIYLEEGEDYELFVNCDKYLKIQPPEGEGPPQIWTHLSYKYEGEVLVLGKGYKF